MLRAFTDLGYLQLKKFRMKMDLVFIEALQVYTTIGVYDWEQTIKQKLVFDIEMAHDNRPAAETDDVSFALDYAKVSQRIIEFVSSQNFALIETVSEQVAALIQTEFSVPWVRIKLTKPDAVAQAGGWAS